MAAEPQKTGPLLLAKGIVKRFPGMVALDHVDFDLAAGEIHGLMGENGAGKSTLLKIITGAYSYDEGQLFLEGNPISPSSPMDAASLGIRCVYQEVNLTPNLSVAENVCLGNGRFQSKLISWSDMRRSAEEALAKLGLSIDVRLPLSSYSIALQQLIAIGRAILEQPKALILDEPTSSLDTSEVDVVFGVMTKLKEAGIGIIFVSHFLGQVYEICDRLTVLRNGKLAGTGVKSELDQKTLVSLMIGHDVEAPASESRSPSVEETAIPALAAESLGRKGEVGGVSFSVGKGEIVGLAGLLGSGRSETMNLLFGVRRSDRGDIKVNGGLVKRWSCRKAIANGLAFCPEDRKLLAIFPGLSVQQNIVLALQARRKFYSGLSSAQQKRLVDEMIEALKIKTSDVDKPVELLSGGNQQKCILARWLIMKPEILLLDEPTRGIDIGAKEDILREIQSLCGDGAAIVIVDSELDEIVRVAHKIVILRDRKMVGALQGQDVTQEKVMSQIAEGGVDEAVRR